MGDDCTPRNAELLPVEEKDMLSDIFRMIAACLPQMRDVIWAVDSGKKVIGYIVVGMDKQARFELCQEDQLFCELDIEALHCSFFPQNSFVYRNGKDGEVIENYPECRTLLDKVRCCMKERFLYELKVKGGKLMYLGRVVRKTSR